MRVVMISKALVMGAYHKKLEELASLGVTLRLIIPHRWGSMAPEITRANSYEIVVVPAVLTGHNHFHFYRRLQPVVAAFKPDLIHIDEEPFSTVTYQSMRIANGLQVPSLFFAWQNILKKYPVPFSWIEQYNFRTSKAAIAGNREAKEVLRKKGYEKSVAVIPQFGIDPTVFRKLEADDLRMRLFGSDEVHVIGYGGRLVEEKGVMLLVEAFARLPENARLLLIGDGPLKDQIRTVAVKRGIEKRLVILGSVPSQEMPQYLNCLSCLVLPSLTRSNWKEQFGRILIEAMACEVPVIGSDSGEIPSVIGDAGVVVPEGNVEALTNAIESLLGSPHGLKELARRGRERVLQHFTQHIIAEQTLQVYREVLAG